MNVKVELNLSEILLRSRNAKIKNFPTEKKININKKTSLE